MTSCACRTQEDLTEKSTQVCRLIYHQQHMAVKIGNQVIDLINSCKLKYRHEKSQALAAQAAQHKAEVQRFQHAHTAMHQRTVYLEDLLRSQAVQPQQQSRQLSDGNQQQLCLWLQDQLRQCKAELQKQHRHPSNAELQKRVSELGLQLQQRRHPSNAELQKRVSELELQLQQSRADLQRFRGQPTSAQCMQRVLQLQAALKQQSEAYTAKMKGVQAGVEQMKKSLGQAAWQRERSLKQQHMVTVKAQGDMLTCQTAKAERYTVTTSTVSV